MKKLTYKVKEWYYVMQIEAYTSELFDLKDIEESAMFDVMFDRISYNVYKKVGRKKKKVEDKRMEYIVKYMELDVKQRKK